QVRTLVKGFVYHAELSPDGKSVAFWPDAVGNGLGHVTGGCGLCIVPAGGGQARDLGVSNVSRWVAWSPDSKRLLFAIYEFAASPLARLSVEDADGTHQQTLTPPLTNTNGGTS